MKHVFLLIIAFFSFSFGGRAEEIFEELKSSLYQIQVRGSSKKSVIGSGFRVGNSVIATNFHVISLFANEPGPHKIVAIDVSGNEFQVDLLKVDPVSDLALLGGDLAEGKILPLGRAKALRKGESLFSLGNPQDLGLTVVEGSYSGRLKEGLYRRLHFTGSLNGGMSGGPSVNDQGEVIGVNVARTGEQIGFLVGEERLRLLLSEPRGEVLNQAKQIEKKIEARLTNFQQEFTEAILNQNWDIDTLGQVLVPSNPGKILNCWGGDQESEEEEDAQRALSCNSLQDVFLGDFERTGTVEIDHALLENSKWNSFQFADRVTQNWSYNQFVNLFGFLDAPEEKCFEKRVLREDGPWRHRVCLQAHEKYGNIFNVSFRSLHMRDSQWAILSTLRLTGFSKDNALRLIRHFREALRCLN